MSACKICHRGDGKHWKWCDAVEESKDEADARRLLEDERHVQAIQEASQRPYAPPYFNENRFLRIDLRYPRRAASDLKKLLSK